MIIIKKNKSNPEKANQSTAPDAIKKNNSKILESTRIALNSLALDARAKQDNLESPKSVRDHSDRVTLVLFSGPSGTGKTTAAQVLASKLGVDLFRIDLSQVVNKYIGETEKNLATIFDKAESYNTILFFDEADAIFGKRTQIKDRQKRFANQEVSYLLQQLEKYNGLAIIAVKNKRTIDKALLKRFKHIIEF